MPRNAASSKFREHVEYERHYYSTPYQLAGQVVEVRATQTTIEVFFNNKRVASHARVHVPGRHTTEHAHMPASHRRHLEWTPERIVHWAQKNGPSTGAFIDALMKSRPHPEQGFRSALGVIRLEKKYGGARLEDACARSLTLRAFSYKSVASILQHGLDQQPLGRESPRARVTHHNLRGPNYYQ
ncbi:MAG: Mu transposase domain-containing protein [Acidiferrobacteraceae bacterium]